VEKMALGDAMNPKRIRTLASLLVGAVLLSGVDARAAATL